MERERERGEGEGRGERGEREREREREREYKHSFNLRAKDGLILTICTKKKAKLNIKKNDITVPILIHLYIGKMHGKAY